MLKTLCAAVLLLLAGSAQAEPQKAVKTAAPEKAAPPCPKIDFTVADVVRKREQQQQHAKDAASHSVGTAKNATSQSVGTAPHETPLTRCVRSPRRASRATKRWCAATAAASTPSSTRLRLVCLRTIRATSQRPS